MSGSAAGTFADTESDAPSFSTNAAITSGSDIETATETDTTTQTYSESGSRTVSWATGNYNAGSYSQTETTTLSDAQYDSASLALGTNATIASGTGISSTTASYSDSQSDLESGSEVATDPAGGPPPGGLVQPVEHYDQRRVQREPGRPELRRRRHCDRRRQLVHVYSKQLRLAYLDRQYQHRRRRGQRLWQNDMLVPHRTSSIDIRA